MAKPNTQARIAVVIIVFVPIFLFAYFYLFTEPVFSTVPYAYSVVEEDTVYHELPVFTFYTLEGDSLTKDDLKGKVVLMDFFSVRDDSLPVTKVLHGNLELFYDNIKWEMTPDFLFLSVNTGDPLPDVKEYARKLNKDEKYWRIVTADQEDIFRVGQGAFMLDEFVGKAPGIKPFTAQEIALIDKVGKVRKFYIGTDLQTKRPLFEDYITLLKLEYNE